jgi:hypothetical protein
MGRNEAVLRVTIGSKQLGARKKKKKRRHHKIRNFSPEELRGFEDPATESDSDEVLNQKEFEKIVQGLTSDSEAEAATNGVVPTELVDETVPVKSSSEEEEQGSKATHNCCKNDGTKLKQEELFPKLQVEIMAKRKELWKPMKYPDAASRRTPEYRTEMEKEVKGRIGGTPQEQE